MATCPTSAELPPPPLSLPGIAAAEEKLAYLGMSKEDSAKYDADLDAASNLASEFATAIADGEAIGIEKANLEIARSMKKDGVDPKVITKYTGLSLEEIEQIQ